MFLKSYLNMVLTHENLFLIVICMFPFLAFTQELSQLRIVDNPEYLPSKLIDNDIRDLDGEIFAGFLMKSDLIGLTYDSNNGIIKIKQQTGTDLLFLSPNERVVTPVKTGYESLKIILNEFYIILKSGEHT
jgi:hypothetical protein